MKTLDEYIREQQESLQKEPAASQRKQLVQNMIKAHEKKGFFEIGENLLTQQTPDQILVTLHNPASVTSKKGIMHRHHYFEMMYVYRGSCRNKTPQDMVPLHEGDIVLLNPNVLHCAQVECSDDVLLNFWIPNDLIQRNIIPMLRDNPIFMSFFIDFFYRFPESKRVLYFSKNPSEIRQLCNRMCLESFQRQDFSASILESSLTILFALLAREYKTMYQISETPSKDCQIYDILTYIEQNCTDVTLELLSRQFPYTPAYLSRLIKKHTGKSFSEIVQSQRMARVVQYLTSTTLPIIDIANLAGFSDIVYFNKVFKARFGMSPTEYRRSF